MADRLMVAVVDDHPLFREGVAHSLRTQPGITVIAEGANAADALAIAADQPDVMLLDVSMPGGGLAALGRITAAYPVVKVVMLTVSESEEDVTAALRAGAKGYVLKGVAARELVGVVRAVAAGEVYVTPSLATTLLVELSVPTGKTPASPLADLTERERQIIDLVAAGDSNKEIAAGLGLSEKTVKHHMTNILQKLHVRNRVEAALLAKGSQIRGS